MSFGGFGGTIEAPEVAAVFDSIPALQAPDIDIPVSQLGPSPQDIQLQQQVFDDLAFAPQPDVLGLNPVDIGTQFGPEAQLALEIEQQRQQQTPIQTGLGILAEDADPFVPSGLLPLDESGQRQLAIPLQIQDVARQFLTPANVLGLLSPGLGAATRIGGPLLRDIFTTPKLTPEQEVLNTQLTTDALTGQPVGLPDLDELRRQQIGLPVEEEETTTDESPFFQPVTDVAFLDPREPNLLNQTPANLQAFLTARNLPNVDFQALNTAFAQRPPFGLPIASNTRTPSLLS